ncbi:class I SAM-dependent methyltransferase, partial [Gaiella sp.]|uniref:class I SAM-dependent methyltransferase n=1 Tax=Gaiella sp. TaxID=2663207 RepID=UPI002C656050
ATGTGAVALELVRQHACSVVGVDRSAEMLAVARARIAAQGLDSRIELSEARAEALPFAAASFDALTVTYLLRYVDDPAATLAELARVVRPGGTIAMLEFGLPRGVSRPAWDVWVGVGLPLAGRLVSPGWHDVGRFLGPSIRSFHAAYPEPKLLALWRDAGVEDVRSRRLSLGGGLVVWGVRSRVG